MHLSRPKCFIYALLEAPSPKLAKMATRSLEKVLNATFQTRTLHLGPPRSSLKETRQDGPEKLQEGSKRKLRGPNVAFRPFSRLLVASLGEFCRDFSRLLSK